MRVPQEIYFAVGCPDELHSAIWKAKTQGDEFYAMALDVLGPVCKLSVHRSGICRLASTDSAPDDLDWDQEENNPDLLKRWTIPGVDDPDDGVLCFTLLVPTVHIPDRVGVLKKTPQRVLERMNWIEPPPMRRAASIQFIRTKGTSKAAVAPFIAGGQQVAGSLALRSGGRIWCIVAGQALSAKDYATWQKQVSDAIFTMNEPVLDGHSLAALQVPTDFSSPVVIEMALGLSNMKFQPT